MTNITQSEIRAKAEIEREAIGNPERKGVPLREPSPMRQEAYYGIMGEIVEKILPHTEASPEALLFDTAVQLGSAIGRGPHANASGAKHTANEYVVIVGPTSMGAKGGSHPHGNTLMKIVDEDWAMKCQGHGLSSGEGITHWVRDATYKDDGTLLNEGVVDKRLLFYEPELASIFEAMSRQSSTLSSQLRKAWDDGDLRTMNKNSSERATGAHISVIGHITPEELTLLMTANSIANGLGNRFTYCWSKASKLLPEGGGYPDFTELAPRVRDALRNGAREHRYTRNDEAKAVWNALYPALKADAYGMAGKLNARAVAHALRFQFLYAALEGSPVITPEHVEASMAVIEYSQQTVAYVFGDATGNAAADRILKALRDNGLLTRSGVHALFYNGLSAARLQVALDLLESMVLATSTMRANSAGGAKPVEVWEAV